MFKKVIGQIDINKFFKKPNSESKPADIEPTVPEPVEQQIEIPVIEPEPIQVTIERRVSSDEIEEDEP